MPGRPLAKTIYLHCDRHARCHTKHSKIFRRALVSQQREVAVRPRLRIRSWPNGPQLLQTDHYVCHRMYPGDASSITFGARLLSLISLNDSQELWARIERQPYPMASSKPSKIWPGAGESTAAAFGGRSSTSSACVGPNLGSPRCYETRTYLYQLIR